MRIPRRWLRRLASAVLMAASVLGCGSAGCTSTTADRPPTLVAVPVPPVAPTVVADVVGVWRVSVNGAPTDTLIMFWPGGVAGTTDPAYGMWRYRPGGAEGTWEVPVAGLSISYVVQVAGDVLVGSGVVVDLARPGSAPHPLRLAGSRVTINPAVAQIAPLPT